MHSTRRLAARSDSAVVHAPVHCKRGQHRPDRALPVPEIVRDTLRSPGQPLGVERRAVIGPTFGYDFSHVRVHTDAGAAEAARSVRALAFTVGRHVVLNRDAVEPESAAGTRLLTHELTHVVQQERSPAVSRSVVPPLFGPNGSATSETQADAAADAVGGARFGAGVRYPLRADAQPSPLLARKGDPKVVAGMDPKSIQADPDYIENGLVRMEFFGAEEARLHYSDGASLLIGLTPRWVKPPMQSVDYQSGRGDYAAVDQPGQGLGFIKDPGSIPGDVPFGEALKKYSTNVTFSVDAGSGKIIPNHLNPVTAPYLCGWLRATEAEYVKNFDEMAQGMIRILKIQKLIIELALMRATIPGPKVGAPAGAPAAVAGTELSSAAAGRVIGWGEGATTEAVAQTEAVTQRLTAEAVKGMIKQGLTKQWVLRQLELYESAIVKGGAKLKNAQLLPRRELMKKLIELWPK